MTTTFPWSSIHDDNLPTELHHMMTTLPWRS